MVSVEAGLLITARHCVQDVVDDAPDAVGLYFLDPADWGLANPRTSDRKGTVIARGRKPDDDWAVIRVTGGLPGWAKALPVSDLPIREDDAWTTAGYPGPGLANEIGEDFDGRVVNTGALVKLENASARDRPVSGISGAPCVIEGRAHGVIVRADEQGSLATTGLFYAVPFSRVARDLPSTVPFEREPPFLALASKYLKDGIGLRDIIEQLLDESASEIRQLEQFVAWHALVRGVARAAEVAIRALVPWRGREADDLVAVAAAQWFPAAGAAALAERLSVAPPARRAAAINVACPDLVELYVRRAGFELNGATAWHDGRIDVSWVPGVGEDDLVGEVTRVLHKRLLGPAIGDDEDWRPYVPEVAAELAQWFDPAQGRWILQFVILPIGSPRSAIERLATAYPALAIVVRTDGADVVSTTGVPLIEPALCSITAHRASWRRACRQLKTHFKEGR